MLNLKPERLDAGEFNEQPLSICGKAFIADSSGSLYWPAEQALIVADLVLPSTSGSSVGDMLTALAQAIDRTRAMTVICLGNGLGQSDVGGIRDEDLDTLRMLQDDREWIWISQFQESEPTLELGGHVRSELVVEGLTLRHQPRVAAVTHEIAGALRPAARISVNEHSIRRPCFAGNGRRLILPAFAAFSGGLNVLDRTFAPLFGNGGQSVWMLGQEGLYPIASRLLRED
ncbi:MAG: phosphoesterase [Hyphomicrobium sp.]